MADLMTDEQVEEFSRRMSERGIQEDMIYDPDEWEEFAASIMDSERGYSLSSGQADALERGRNLLAEHHLEAEVRILPSRMGERPSYRYADLNTGRIISAEEAYTRLERAGVPVPRFYKYT